MNDLISIIIPCYNGEKYLKDALASVLWQTHTNWECILVDDGSTDGSAELFNQFVQKDNRFRYFRQKNSGPSVARNNGIVNAKGRFIQFLDADDIILPKRLEQCFRILEQSKQIDVVYTDYMTFQSGQGYSRILPAKMPYEDPVRSFLFENNLTFVVLIHTLMFRTEAISQNKFNSDLHSHAEDIECWVRMSVNGIRFQYLDEILSIYRYTEHSLGSDEVKLLNAKIRVLEQYRGHPKCTAYHSDFQNAMMYHSQRLVIAYFMARSFKNGFSSFKNIWDRSTLSAIIKMLGWGFLMVFFSKETIANSRAWIVKHTPLKWGAWKQIQVWSPPQQLRELLGE